MENQETISIKRKAAISILFGLISLLLSPYGIETFWKEIPIDIPWSPFLPILAALAYGWQYGLLSGISGGALFPFLLWANNGWSNIGTSLIFAVSYALLGLFNDQNRIKRLRNLPIRIAIALSLSILSFYLFNRFLFNPLLGLNEFSWDPGALKELPQNLILGFALKDGINLIILTIASETLLRLSFVRRMLGKPTVPAMQANSKILIVTISTFLIVWLAYSGLAFALLKEENILHEVHYFLALFVLLASSFVVSIILFNYNEYQFVIKDNLNKSEGKFRALFENANDGIFIMDEGTIIDCNPATLKIFGCTTDEIIGSTPSYFSPVYQADGRLSVSLAEELIKNSLQGTSQRFEWQHQRLDGTIFDAEISLNRIDINHKVLLQAIVRDVSERKKAEDAIRQGKDRYKAAQKVGQVGSWEYDLITKQVWGSEEAKRIYGYNIHSELFTPNDIYSCVIERERAEQALYDLIHESKPYNVEFEIIPFNQTEKKYIHSVAELIKDEAGTPLKVTGVIHDITERKKAEETISMLAHAIRSISECISITDMEDQIIFVNNAFLNTYQYEEQELIGKSVKMVQSPNNPQSVLKEILPSTLRGGWQGELLNLRKDGSEFPIFLSTSVIHDETEKPIAIIGVATNITIRKQAEEALLVSEEKYRTIFENVQDVFYQTDLHGIVREISPSIVYFSDFIRDEIIGQPVSNLYYNPADRNLLLQEILRKGEIRDYQLMLKSKTGKVKYGSINARLITNPDGSLKHINGSIRDITERKLAESKLESERSLLRTLVDLLPELIYVKDLESRFIMANQACATYLGVRSPMELIGKSDFDYYIEEDARRFRMDELNVLEGNSFLNKEEGGVLPNGKQLSLLTSKVPIRDSNGIIFGFVGTSHDITEIKRAEMELIKAKEKAEESVRLKSAFLANLSHEIRTPMNGILGFAELLKEPNLDGNEQRFYIQLIEQSGGRMLNLMNNLIDISKIESEEVKFRMSSFDVRQEFENVYQVFRKEAEDKGLKLILNHSLTSNVSWIRTDSEKFSAIFINLISNAIKFTSQGFVEFGGEKRGDDFHFFVKDSGVGIDPEHHEIVFDSFRQASESLSRSYEGAGLGLSISKAYVEMLGGKIWVESQIGKGAEFYFTLPFSRVNAVDEEI